MIRSTNTKGVEKLSYVSVYNRLRDEILTCAIQPGAQIFEQELARRFNVSKSPIRDALLRLKEQHLVEVQPRRGYRVRPISVTEAEEMYEMRVLYETACAAHAVDHAAPEDLAHLRSLCGPPDRADVPGWLAKNKEFHIALAHASGNSRLAHAAAELIDQFDRFTYVSADRLSKPLDLTRFIDEHRSIVDAIEAKNRRLAQKIIRRHVEDSRKRTLDAFRDMVIVA